MIAETAEELRAIARSTNDAAGYFPALYSLVTSRVASGIAEGRFTQAARMDTFATTFADYYLRAWHREVGRPRCWQATWDVAADPNLLIVQHLLLGINAHVNNDLAQAVVEVAGPAGDLTAIRPDFDAVNDVLAETYVDVVNRLDRVSRWSNRAANLGGGRVFNFSLRVARSRAWSAAEQLHGLPSDEDRQQYLHELDDLVAVVAFVITRPVLPARPLVWLARRLEQHDPAKVTAALLGDT